MSLKCQIFQTRLTFNKNVFAKNCDVRLIIILCVISAILPNIKCAKLENPQIRLLINDDDLLQEKTNIHEASSAAANAALPHDHSGEHFNLYRSELKRLSYETIHRILRDENEPSYRREETELRYYQKRSPSYEASHQLIKRSAKEKPLELNLSERNLTEFSITSQIRQRLNLVSVLDLSRNSLNHLNISQLDNLTSLSCLDLRNNTFTRIPVSPETKLKTLNLNSNLIAQSNLSSNVYLKNLYLAGNLIESLSSVQLSLLKNLESLDVSHNLLHNSESSFFLERMHNLKHLNLAFNQLGFIYRETFYNLLSLNTLLLSHNNITDIDYETFLALPNLQFLDLSSNNLQGKSIRALQGITGLVALNIAFNPDIGAYMQEFVASWSLKELDASGTGLCQIPAALAQSVRTLKLTHNWLRVINCGDLDSYPLLQYLDLSFSHIDHIEDDALGRLEILEILMLDHNQLHKVPFSLPVSLEHLFLQNNEIMEITQQSFQGLINLKTLDLSHNKLLYLPDIMLPKLQTLNLQSSEITGISQGIIHSLPKLTDLMLEDNPIKCADLLGIAEWASTCRLRSEKEGEGEQLADEQEEDNFVLRIQDLKNKFDKMHNFYEQFDSNNTLVNVTLLAHLKAPACVKDSENHLQQVQNSNREDKEMNKNMKTNFFLKKTLHETYLNSMLSRPLAAATVTKQSLENDTRTMEPFEDKNAVKTFNIKYSAQTMEAALQPSSLNEKQKASFTSPNSFDSNTATTTTNTTKADIQDATNEELSETEIVAKSKITNELKIFNDLQPTTDTANVATTTRSQEETAATKSSSNVTQVEERTEQKKLTLSKALKSVKRNSRVLTDFPFPAKGKDMMLSNLDEHSNSTDITTPQFIKSTTIAMPINSEKQVTTTATPPTATLKSTAAALATAFIPEAVTQTQQKNKHEYGELKAREEKLKEQLVHNVAFGRTTSNLEINLEKDKQQQQEKYEIKTKVATTKEIKSLAAKSPKSVHTNRFETAGEAAAAAATTQERTGKAARAATTTTTTNLTMAKRTLKIPPELTANLDKTNKELNGFIQPTSPTTTSPTDEILTTNLFNIPTTATTTTTATHKPAIEEKHEQIATASVAAAVITKTFKTIEQQMTATTAKPTATATTTTARVTDKNLASNYNGNENRRQITKTINKTSNILPTTATAATTRTNTMPTTSSSSSSSSTTDNNKNNQIAKIFDTSNTTTTATTMAPINNQQQQPSSIPFQNLVSHHRQLSQKHVIVKCTPSTSSHECHSADTTATTQRPDEIGKTPTIEVTLEQTTASKTSTEIPKAPALASSTTTTTTPVIHRHEPLQLLVKDRHLIGTPLLMHKGENLMVTADELILPTNNHNVEQEENNNKNNNNKEHHNDFKANSMANNNNKYRPHLETSQNTKSSETTTATIPNNQAKAEQTIDLRQNMEFENPVVKQKVLGKMKKTTDETKNKKPSLIMKKMTIITKQHEGTQHVQSAQPLENEAHAKQFDNSHYQELKPLTANLEKQVSKTHTFKHNTVNTPIHDDNHEEDNRQLEKLVKQPHSFQHEHELLIQQILQDQQLEPHAKLTKSEQWSDLRKAESKDNHPGVILLVSSGLFIVLLVGLMHVYRCDMPWRRHSPTHHLRPHQRQNHSLEDDSHSFLSYSEGMQKWHHSTRLEAPYNSPLHNLHVRELQKISATEKPATVKSTIKNFNPPPVSRSIALESSRSLSLSSTTTTSTASASSSAILDDESFYIEMTPDSGQFSSALQSELLPMELLNMTQMQTQTLDYQDNMGDSQTSMEDECTVHYQQQQHTQQQQQQRHLHHLSSLPASSSSASAAASNGSAKSTCPASSAPLTASHSVKPLAPTRKFGLW